MDDGCIRSITTAGVVTTIAGVQGQYGAADGQGVEARFGSELGALALDAEGNILAGHNSVIRKISPTGKVTTIAGEFGTYSHVDGPVAEARFDGVRGLVFDSKGNLIVASWTAIRKLSPDRVVSTIAGAQYRHENIDGNGTNAGFIEIMGMAIDPSDNLYIVDRYGVIRKIDAENNVTTLAGFPWGDGFVDAIGDEARFYEPWGVAVRKDGSIIIADLGNRSIRKLQLSSRLVQTVAGRPGLWGVADGNGSRARFMWPQGVAVVASGTVFVADSGNHTIRKITPEGEVSTFAGRAGTPGDVDGHRLTARFDQPRHLKLDGLGNLYVFDWKRQRIRMISPEGVVSTIPTPGVGGLRDFAVDGSGNIFLVTVDRLFKRSSGGEITLLAGSDTLGVKDGRGADAWLDVPTVAAVDKEGNIYLGETYRIRKVTPEGDVTVLAGSRGFWVLGTNDGSAEARFRYIQDIVVDRDNSLIVADGPLLRRVLPDGTVSTLAGDPAIYSIVNGPADKARFAGPTALAMDESRNIYLTEVSLHGVRRGVLTVGLGDPGVRWKTPTSINYGQALTRDKLNADAGVEGTFSYTPPADTILSAGAQALNVTFTPTDEESFSSKTITTTITVNKAELSVAAENKTRKQGQENPTLTLLYSGFVNGDTAAAIDQVPAMATTATIASDPGTYPIRLSGGSDDNYTFAFTNGALTVLPAQSLAGAYFGVLAGGRGNWALRVEENRRAVFIAFLKERKTAIVTNLTISEGGLFTTTGTSLSENVAGSRLVRAMSSDAGESSSSRAAVAFALSGTIADGAVTGQISGLEESFTGSIDEGGGAAPSGFYSAAAVGSTGSSYAIVAPSGQALIVVSIPGRLDAASGVIGSGGQVTMSTVSGGQLMMTVRADAATMAVTLTPAGSATPILFGDAATQVPGGTPEPEPPPVNNGQTGTRLVALAARAAAGSGDQTLIMGFVLQGNKQVLVQGVGPGIAGSVPTALTDPQLKVYRLSGGSWTQQAENNDWVNGAEILQARSRLGATAVAANSKDAALLQTLGGGVYTAHVTSSGPAGVALVEAYDADQGGSSRLVALSTRTVAGAGDATLIAGLVLEGSGSKRVLIRGLGPTLASRDGVSGVLSDPQLKLYRMAGGTSTLVGENDDWGGSAEMKSVFTATGAGAISSDSSKDSAMLVTLEPGVYTVHVSGAAGTTGVALVEIFDVP